MKQRLEDDLYDCEEKMHVKQKLIMTKAVTVGTRYYVKEES